MADSAARTARYRSREVLRLLGVSRGTLRGLVGAGFVTPARGARREYLFCFQDLVLLRAARALAAAKVPARRITRSLRRLRRSLPDEVPLSGLRICAVGERVVVREGARRWQADTGQYLLDFDVVIERGEPVLRAHAETPALRDAEAWFERGAALEERGARSDAREAYARSLEIDSDQLAARINLGRLLHEAGRLDEAEAVYRGRGEPVDPTLCFNLAILLEDLERRDEAIAAYHCALRGDPRFADCHYNLGLAYQAAGNALAAIRHLREYRKLSSTLTPGSRRPSD